MINLAIRITLLLLITMLFACGNDIETDSAMSSQDNEAVSTETEGNEENNENPVMPENDSEEVLSDVVARGKALYESVAQGCLSCHGKDGQSDLFKKINLSTTEYEHSSNPGVMLSLEEYLTLWMPVGNASICMGNCSTEIAAYIDHLASNASSDPEPTPTPTPSPGPEPTPTPEPTPNPEPEPTPTPEPAPNPVPEPTPEPEPSPILTIQELMQQPELNCTNSNCHDSTPGSARVDLVSGDTDAIALRLVSQAASSQGCSDELLIDPENIENSLLLKLIDSTSGDQCTAKMPFGKTGISAKHYDQFVVWVNELITAAPPVVIEPPPAPEPPANTTTVNSLSIVNKAKVLLHGGAVTSAELNRVSDGDGQLLVGRFRELIREWMQTPEFDNKLASFLRLSLQQDIVSSSELYTNQLGLNVGNNRQIDLAKTRSTLRESFLRTAIRIVNTDSDFREVVTTRDWEVTTALLAMLSHADQQNIPNAMRFGRFPNLTDSDYSDWRTVRLAQGTSPSNYAHTLAFLDGLRSITDGEQYSLFAPRVGFFSTPIFIQNWETNEDNQFRINTNQTMIAALGLSFEAGDTTVPNHLQGLDQEHANPGTDCFACHQHLDPMRNIFANHYNADTLRTLKTPLAIRPDFAFHGERQTIQTMDDFANAIAAHPYFATAWVAKLCQWANSFECDQDSSEFIELVSIFENSNFNMKTLMVRLFSSPLFTEASSDSTEALVSINRRDHFCSALDVRLANIRSSRNLPPANTDYCNINNNSRRFAGLIPNDDYVRGQVSFLQPNQNDFLVVKSVESLCDINVTRVVGNRDSDTFSTRRIESSLDDMVSFIMGVPTGSENHALTRTTLQQVYDVSRAQPVCSNPNQLELNNQGDIACGFGLSTNQSLRVAWKMACSSPSLTALGL